MCIAPQYMTEPADPNLAADEARRALQHEAIKSRVEGDVGAEIAARAGAVPKADTQHLDRVAGTFREHAVDEVVQSERDVHRSRGTARLSQFIDYAFFLIYALLLTRLVLALVGARSSVGFVKFVARISDPFFAPFKGIVASPKEGEFTLALPIVVALAAYAVLHLIINRLLRLIAVRKTEI